MDDGDGQISKQGEGISEKEAVDLNPQVIHVNLEDEEVKCDEKLDENCEKGKKGSVVWDYFNRIPGLPVGKEKAKCGLCNVIIGCYSRNGTSAMMNHLKTVCPKSPLRNNLDKLQKTLRFEIISKEDKTHNVKAHTFNQERCQVDGPLQEIVSKYMEKSSLSPKTAEALVCSQDWLRTSEIVIDLRGEPEEYLQHEKLENDETTVFLHFVTKLFTEMQKVYRGCKCRLQGLLSGFEAFSVDLGIILFLAFLSLYLVGMIFSDHTFGLLQQAAVVLNSSRRFRYTLGLQGQEVREKIRGLIRAHAQVISESGKEEIKERSVKVQGPVLQSATKGQVLFFRPTAAAKHLGF
ncbi:hypothetical protein POM88_033238 [Heracleum sosnowskyi]|uniref:BED-type domain-containing protein n=1 Tax=Heracleum sosnowskyi TaxID=360622 RepID=A0AAD8I1Q2_9APIA|nr:hypothetical protein POM88_033238 [Heracleum sosnowskyi]